jgi:hypothetical protein
MFWYIGTSSFVLVPPVVLMVTEYGTVPQIYFFAKSKRLAHTSIPETRLVHIGDLGVVY